MSTDHGFFSVIDYTVDGPRTQQEVVDAFAEIQERWVRFYPGYRSARFLTSVDGTRVYNLVHWDSEADYRNFVETSDTKGRLAAIHKALDGLSGTAEARMTQTPQYTTARVVEPGPRRTDA
ncbi:antibiotic biosynthesis monooxygenase [Streptomyces sp. MST-110588]|uniref:antibiotic biosynthesis monooxygenase family protein n=1 Tax=Streptomyces sp. MST-110588 TaxID=2833628 RepID=UPI001F5C2A57|nr:antibiotic biosynthesis monooxygenase [Streptomyces sp. MST-110588]UNO40553.1 antibiotic biosynthesis monooxygenase [Streptomyces sp. MST-110588]